MRILAIFSGAKLETGAHYRYMRLLRELQEKGYQVVLLCPKALKEDVGAAEVHYFKPIGVGLRQWRVAKGVRKLLRAQPEIVRDLDKCVVFGAANAYCALANKKLIGVPVIFSARSCLVEMARASILHNEYLGKSSWKELPYLWLATYRESYLFRGTDQLVLQTEAERQRAIKRYGLAPERVHVIPNDCSLGSGAGHLQKTKNKDSLRLLFAGSLSARKGLEVALDAMTQVVANGNAVRLDVAGEGPLFAFYKQYAERLGILERVNFLGYVSGMNKRMSEYDVLVLPSYYEPFANVALEAIAARVLVLSSNTGGIGELLSPTNMVFPVGDVQALASMLDWAARAGDQEFSGLLEAQREALRQLDFDWAGSFSSFLEGNSTSCG